MTMRGGILVSGRSDPGSCAPKASPTAESKSSVPRPCTALIPTTRSKPSCRNSPSRSSCFGSSSLLTTSTTGREARRNLAANSVSRGSNPSFPSTTNSTASAPSRASSAARCVASAKSGSGDAPIPPVSTIPKGTGPKVHSASIRSRVTPGWSWTMEMRRPARRLNSADFPTFGRPTRTAFFILLWPPLPWIACRAKCSRGR